jgi:hypothetical protein
MGKVVKIAAGIFMVAAGVVVGVTGNWMLGGALAVQGISMLYGAATTQSEAALDDRQGAVLENRAGSKIGLPVVYGEVRLAPIMADIRVDTVSKDRKRLVVVAAFCHGSQDGNGIQAIDDIYLDDDLAWDGGVVQSPYSDNIDDPSDSYQTDHLEVTTYLGTDSQTSDSTLGALFPTQWPVTADGLGVAYAVMLMWFNADIFGGGLPRINAIIRGQKLFDPRTSTTVYSTNPALAIRDYLTSTVYGYGIDEADIDDTSFEAAADYCDEMVTPWSGAAQQKRFELSGILDTARPKRANLAELTTACRGTVLNVGGVWKLVIRQAQSSTGLEVTTANTVEGSWKYTLPGSSDVPNSIIVNYIDPDRDYRADTVRWPEPGSNPYLTEDSGYEHQIHLDLPYTTNRLRAQQIGMILLREAREGIVVTLTAKEELLQAEVGDIIDVTNPGPDWNAKPFWVVATNYRAQEMVVDLVLFEYEPSVYTMDEQFPQATIPDTGLPEINTVDPPTSLSLAAGDTEALLTADNVRTPRIKMTWTPATEPYILHYEIQAKPNAESDWDSYGTAGPDDTIFYVSPVDIQYWDVRIRTVTRLGQHSDWVEESITPDVTLTLVEVVSVDLTMASNGDVTASGDILRGLSVRLAWSTTGFPTKATVQAATIYGVDAENIFDAGVLTQLGVGQTLYAGVLGYQNANGTGDESVLAQRKITRVTSETSSTIDDGWSAFQDTSAPENGTTLQTAGDDAYSNLEDANTNETTYHCYFSITANNLVGDYLATLTIRYWNGSGWSIGGFKGYDAGSGTPSNEHIQFTAALDADYDLWAELTYGGAGSGTITIDMHGETDSPYPGVQYEKVTETGVVQVSEGGTSQTTLTNKALLVGAGSSPISALSPAAAGTVPRSNGTDFLAAQLSYSDLSGSLPTHNTSHHTGGGDVIDHGSIGGLGDDDHSQYHNDARGDARYSQLSHVHSEYLATDDNADITGTWEFQDDIATYWGTDGDLKIWWDGPAVAAYIDVITQDKALYIRTTDAGGIQAQVVVSQTSVSLSYDGSTKLNTTATGVDIYGTLTQITSDTLVTNLNADKLDGQHGAYYMDMDNPDAGTLAVARGGTGVGDFSPAGSFIWEMSGVLVASGYDETSFMQPGSNYDISGTWEFQDDIGLFFGNDGDLKIWWDGPAVAAYIDVITQDKVLNIRTTDAGGIQTQAVFSQTAVSLSYDGSTKLLTTATGIDVTGTITMDTALAIAQGGTGATSFTATQFIWESGGALVASGYDETDFVQPDTAYDISADWEWQDSYGPVWGTDGDVKMWWNNNLFTYIKTNAKQWTISLDDSGDTQRNQVIITSLAVTLAYQGANKLATTATGVDITGTLDATTLQEGSADIDTLYLGITAQAADSAELEGNTLAQVRNHAPIAHDHSTITGPWEFQDDTQLRFGDDADAHLEWDTAAAPGDMYLRVDTQDAAFYIYVRDAGGVQAAAAFTPTASSLAYDGSTKLLTTATGIDVTGTVTMDTALAVAEGGTGATSFTATEFIWRSGSVLVASGYDENSFSLSGHTHDNYVRTDANDVVQANTTWQDDYRIIWGTDADAAMWWDDTYEILKLKISNWDEPLHLIGADAGGETIMAIFTGGAAGQELHYDGSKKFETTSAGATIQGTLTETSQHTHSQYVDAGQPAVITGIWEIQNDTQLRFGNDADAHLEWDTGVSPGDLYLRVDTQDAYFYIYVRDVGGVQAAAVFTPTATTLAYDGSTKFATTATGVDITGTVTMDTALALAEGGTGATNFTDTEFLWESGGVLVASGYDQNSFAAVSHEHTTISGDWEWQDTYSTVWGNDADVKMWWSGTALYTKIFTDASQWLIQLDDSGDTTRTQINITSLQVAIAYQGANKLTTTATGVDITGTLDATTLQEGSADIDTLYLGISAQAADSAELEGNTLAQVRNHAPIAHDHSTITGAWEFQDDIQLRFGDDADAHIEWDTAVAPGDLYLRVDRQDATFNIYVRDAGGVQAAAVFTPTASSLAYDGSTKLLTSTTGVSITGTIAVTTDTLVSNLNADKLDSQHGSYYTDMDNPDAGTLSIARGGTGVGDFSPEGEFIWAMSGVLVASGYDETSFMQPASNYDVSGTWEWQEDVKAVFGNDADAGIRYGGQLQIDGWSSTKNASAPETGDVVLTNDNDDAYSNLEHADGVSTTYYCYYDVVCGGLEVDEFMKVEIWYNDGVDSENWTSGGSQTYDVGDGSKNNEVISFAVVMSANYDFKAVLTYSGLGTPGGGTATMHGEDHATYPGVQYTQVNVGAYVEVFTQDKPLIIRTTEAAGIHTMATFGAQDVTLNYDGEPRFATTNAGATIQGTLTETSQHTHAGVLTTSGNYDITGTWEFQDDIATYWGNDGDLKIWWDGPAVAAYIDVITQDKALYIRTTDAGGIQSQAVFSQTAVSLSYDGSTKLATTATGVDVTGTLDASVGLEVAGSNINTIYAAISHTHVKTDITDTPWAWTDVSKTGSNLTDLATRQISDTTGTLLVARGGTGTTSFTEGYIVYYSGGEIVNWRLGTDVALANQTDTISGTWTFTSRPAFNGGDGSNPPLNADYLDGYTEDALAKSGATDTISGAWTFTNAENNVNGIWDVNNAAGSRLVIPVGTNKYVP